MMTRKFLVLTSMALSLAVLAWGVGTGWAQPPDVTNKLIAKKALDAEKKAAAKRAKDLGLQLGLPAGAGDTPLLGIEGPGGVPHYFGPYGNWAFSPLPTFGIAAVTVDAVGRNYTSPTVTIIDLYGTGTAADGSPLLGSASVTNGEITAITVPPGSKGFHVPFVTITDPTGIGAAATATLDFATLAGGMRKFVDLLPGIPGVTSFNTPANGYVNGANNLGQYIPLAVRADWVDPNGVPHPDQDYYEIALVEYSEQLHSDLPFPTRLRGYVQLETAASGGTDLFNPDGTPILMPNGTQARGKDKPHYLGPIILAQGRAHGVAGAAGQPKPVRIKFYNLLPAGPVDNITGRRPGDLFLPTDETVMGSGFGPALPGTAGEKYTQNRATIHLHGNNTVWISDGNVHQWITPAGERSADNTAQTPYPKGVSVRNVPDMGADCDPGNQNPPVPGNSGCLTFFYTNAQSARLQFYHDHAMGITRLNVYGGEAAGYVLTDAVEKDMMEGTNVSGVNIQKDLFTSCPPGANVAGTCAKVLPDYGIPLIIQDRTFVDNSTIFAQDPTWNWGTGKRAAAVPPETVGRIEEAIIGDLWYPHVYMTVQNPADLTGTNAFGRWHYGPWFNPPVPTCVDGLPVGCIEVGPVPNEYYDPVNAPWEPPMRPGLPNPSMPGESFLDTQLVNGTAYPVLKVEPKAYRFRVLNASNDRFVNLQLYVAADKTAPTTPDNVAAPRFCDGTSYPDYGPGPVPVANCTEVKMVPVSVAPANQYADTPSGIPDPATKGPDWIMIGTEGGFQPKPVVVPQQPIGYNLDPAYFAFGIVNQYSLFLGSAERADVVVDFSKYSGQTLILYNDSPAPVPAGAAPYDYFTGNPSQTDSGGAPTTQPGYGPNTRTIMQIQVGTAVTTPTDDVTLANLEAVFAKGDTTGCPNAPCKRGVFEVTQDPIIMPQAAYNSAYNNAFTDNALGQYIQIADLQKTFQPIDENGVLQPAVTLPLEMKAMHDEMGGVYDTLFGRMSGMLGLSNPLSPVHVLIPYGLASPPTDLVMGSVEGTPIGVMPDGTQIWRIFHNGVDTHTIHTHLFHTQLINRVGQDGQVVGDPVPPTELGWKDTFRVNPLEVTYLAMRPTVPTPAQLPFEAPDSVRLIDPTLPEGATLIPPPPAGWFDPAGNQIEPEILNHYVNFGWEYVWHCHILSHEEMDMMHSLVFAVPPMTPTIDAPPIVNGTTNNRRVTLFWTDHSLKEERFDIQRATDNTFTTGLVTFNVPPNTVVPPSTVTYTDTTVANDSIYWYRVLAIGGLVGDTEVYLNSIGFPTMSANSVSNPIAVQIGNPPVAPTPPTNLTATLQLGPQVSLTWRDNATNETGFAVERCTGLGCDSVPANFARIAAPGPRNNTGNVTYVDTTVTAGNDNTFYSYRVFALNSAGLSLDNTNVASVRVPAIPAAPANATVAVVKANGNNYRATLRWSHPGGNDLTNFTIQRATNASFTTGLNTSTVAGNLRTANQTVTRNTTYYWRIRANNNISGSSAWTNVLPFPIRTGP